MWITCSMTQLTFDFYFWKKNPIYSGAYWYECNESYLMSKSMIQHKILVQHKSMVQHKCACNSRVFYDRYYDTFWELDVGIEVTFDLAFLFGCFSTQRTHGATMTHWWRFHYVETTSATSFRRNEDVIIVSCARWAISKECDIEQRSGTNTISMPIMAPIKENMRIRTKCTSRSTLIADIQSIMFSALQLATPINSVGGNHAQKERGDRGEASENVPGKFHVYI